MICKDINFGLSRFHYMAISDDRQRHMPSPDDRRPERGEMLDYSEAVRLVNPIEPRFEGEVIKDFNRCHAI